MTTLASIRIARLFGVIAVTFSATLAHVSFAASPASDLVARGRDALDAGRVDDALALLEQAVAADANEPAALAWLGSAQVRKAGTAPPFEVLDWVKKGFTTLDDAVERFRDAFVVYVVRGMTALRVPDMFGKTPVAVKDLSTVVALKERNASAVPDSVMPSVYLNLGLALKKNGQPGEARAAWEKAKTRYPSAPEMPAIQKELSLVQAPPAGFPNVVGALRTTPGCLGVETAQTASGKRVIFAWFEGKKALVDWYHGEVHQKAMKTVFPDQTFDRQPLPDLADDSGPILAIVSVKFAGTPKPDGADRISSIGIELYGPLPGGVVLGGRFAPEAVKVRGLREIEVGTAQGRTR